jgi:5'-nucleotidase
MGWFNGQRPLVLSGINPGANAGVDVFYSGTVAVIREALILGCSAIAVSQLTFKGGLLDWNITRDWATEALSFLLPKLDQQMPQAWNINLPDQTTWGKALPAIHLVPMSLDPHPISYQNHPEEPGALAFIGAYPERQSQEGTDVSVLFKGGISITPLGLDLTDTNLLEKVIRTPR